MSQEARRDVAEAKKDLERVLADPEFRERCRQNRKKLAADLERRIARLEKKACEPCEKPGGAGSSASS